MGNVTYASFSVALAAVACTESINGYEVLSGREDADRLCPCIIDQYNRNIVTRTAIFSW
jgi:hypothetical protein